MDHGHSMDLGEGQGKGGRDSFVVGRPGHLAGQHGEGEDAKNCGVVVVVGVGVHVGEEEGLQTDQCHRHHGSIHDQVGEKEGSDEPEERMYQAS